MADTAPTADDFLAGLDAPARVPLESLTWDEVDLPPDADPLARPESPAAARDAAHELVIDRATGAVRQAGALLPGPWVDTFRTRAESSLFLFAFAVLGLSKLTRPLHRPITQWLMRVPPFRKLYLLPRDHLKTSIARALVIHLLLQPRERNAYFPGCRDAGCRGRRTRDALGETCANPRHCKDGASLRILYAGETSTNAQHQLRWIEARYEDRTNLLRALWPHRLWDNPRKESRKWNEAEMLLQRPEDFPEASVETIGVGGAVTGRHYDVMVKDDLISIEAANSAIVMQTAIEWHKSSRALLDDPDESLEFILGTKWAVGDLYDYIIEKDPSVEVVRRAVVEDGQPIFPEGGFSHATIQRLRSELGPLFQLLYMNDAADPELTDFGKADLRDYDLLGDRLVFAADERDLLLQRRAEPVAWTPADVRGQRLSDVYDNLKARGEFLRGVRA